MILPMSGNEQNAPSLGYITKLKRFINPLTDGVTTVLKEWNSLFT